VGKGASNLYSNLLRGAVLRYAASHVGALVEGPCRFETVPVPVAVIVAMGVAGAATVELVPCSAAGTLAMNS
jgi:hypothetical protein